MWREVLCVIMVTYLCPLTVQSDTPHNDGSTLANSGIYEAFYNKINNHYIIILSIFKFLTGRNSQVI